MLQHRSASYVCSGKAKAIQAKRVTPCPARFLPATQLDALVWQDLCELLTHPTSITEALRRAQDGGWLPQELHARRATLHKGQRSLTHPLERLPTAYLHGIIH
jgi:site-specific DNA recombinase